MRFLFYKFIHDAFNLIQRLKSRGLDISSTGVAVKTSQRYTREDQLDATQRCVSFPVPPPTPIVALLSQSSLDADCLVSPLLFSDISFAQ